MQMLRCPKVVYSVFMVVARKLILCVLGGFKGVGMWLLGCC